MLCGEGVLNLSPGRDNMARRHCSKAGLLKKNRIMAGSRDKMRGAGRSNQICVMMPARVLALLQPGRHIAIGNATHDGQSAVLVRRSLCAAGQFWS
jgi:hypothetical protein